MKRPLCLIVDDDAELRRNIARLLDMSGVDSIEAENGEVALEKLSANPTVRLVVTDVRMPVMTGTEFVSCMRSMGNETPVIFCSGYADKEMAFEAIRLGACEFLEKPFKRDVFFEAIKRAIGKSQAKVTESLSTHGLNATQRQIAELICDGVSNQEIGAKVGLAEATVKYHVGKLLKQFEVVNRADLARKIKKAS